LNRTVGSCVYRKNHCDFTAMGSG